MRYRTRWLMQKEYEALVKVIAYLSDEQKDYEAMKENGESTKRHIAKAVKILAAYEYEIYCSHQALGMSMQSMAKRARLQGIPFRKWPDELDVWQNTETTEIMTTEPDKPRWRPTIRAYDVCGRGRRKRAKK